MADTPGPRLVCYTGATMQALNFAAVLEEITRGWSEPLTPRLLLRQQARIINLLALILKAVEPIQLQPVVEGTEAIMVRTVSVVTSGTIVQGPDVPIHPSFSISIRQRRHSTARTGYIGFSRTAIRRDDTRIVTENNDSITVRIGNFNQIWFDASANSTTFEIMAVR